MIGLRYVSLDASRPAKSLSTAFAIQLSKAIVDRNNDVGMVRLIDGAGLRRRLAASGNAHPTLINRSGAW